MNKAAQQLGRLAAGKPKNYSAEELAKRSARLVKARKEYLKQQRKNARAQGKLS